MIPPGPRTITPEMLEWPGTPGRTRMLQAFRLLEERTGKAMRTPGIKPLGPGEDDGQGAPDRGPDWAEMIHDNGEFCQEATIAFAKLITTGGLPGERPHTHGQDGRVRLHGRLHRAGPELRTRRAGREHRTCSCSQRCPGTPTGWGCCRSYPWSGDRTWWSSSPRRAASPGRRSRPDSTAGKATSCRSRRGRPGCWRRCCGTTAPARCGSGPTTRGGYEASGTGQNLEHPTPHGPIPAPETSGGRGGKEKGRRALPARARRPGCGGAAGKRPEEGGKP